MTVPAFDTTMACTAAVEGLAQLSLTAHSIRLIVSQYSSWSEMYERGSTALIGLVGAEGRVLIPERCPEQRPGEIGQVVSYLDTCWPDPLERCRSPLALVELGGTPHGPYVHISGPHHPSPAAVKAVAVLLERVSDAGLGVCAVADGTGMAVLQRALRLGVPACAVVFGDGLGSARACGGVRERHLAREVCAAGGVALHLRHHELGRGGAADVADSMSVLTLVVEPRLRRVAAPAGHRVVYVQGDDQYGFSAAHTTCCERPETVVLLPG